MDLPYYHGRLTKAACENLLLREGKDGKFLLRDSESIPEALCLCVLFHKKIYTYRIRKDKNGYYTIETAEYSRKMLFPSLKELISKFEKPDQGLVVQLRYPVKKSNVYQTCRNSSAALHDDDEEEEDDDDYVNVSKDDYIQVLP